MPIFFSIFFLLITSSNAYAQSSDCWKEYSDIKPICDQAITEQNLLEKCDRANNTFHQCLGVDKNPWKLQSSKPGHLSCKEWKNLSIIGTASNCVAPVTELFEKKLWCLNSAAEISQVRSHPVDYILDFDPYSCILTEDDVRQFKASLPSTSGSSSNIQNQQTKLPPASSNILSINPLETWRNIQGLLSIPEGLGSLVQAGEFLTGSTELKIQVPEPAIATDSEGKPWDFLPGYIPHESINLGKSMRISEGTKISAGGVNQGSDKKLLNLEEGEIEVIKNEPDVTDSEYDGIKTPNATVLSIQTHYWVSYDKKTNQTTVAVYEGKVEVKINDGKTITITPNEGKPGLVVVSQKLSINKLAIAGAALAATIGGVVFLLKKRDIKTSAPKKKTSK